MVLDLVTPYQPRAKAAQAAEALGKDMNMKPALEGRHRFQVDYAKTHAAPSGDSNLRFSGLESFCRKPNFINQFFGWTAQTETVDPAQQSRERSEAERAVAADQKPLTPLRRPKFQGGLYGVTI